MRLSIGYPVFGGENFSDFVCNRAEHIAEVYFALPGFASGRCDYMESNSYEVLCDDLTQIASAGIALNVLFNGNCYGETAISRTFAAEINASLDRLIETTGKIDYVTTTSPFVSHVIRQRGVDIKIRASVNMKIGSIEGMKYLSDLFDGFCVQRELNRNLSQLEILREWADKNSKELTLLLNSGCLNYCSNQLFHDNLVAHETGMAAEENVTEFNPVKCWQFLEDQSNISSLIADSNWLRPEDVAADERYSMIADKFKLATRLHPQYKRVVDAYIEGHWQGNTLDLFEPSHSRLFYPQILDNACFPKDWLSRLAMCRTRRQKEDYAHELLNAALISLS